MFYDPEAYLKLKFQIKLKWSKCITSGVSAIGFKWSEKSPPQQVSITTAATKAWTINYYWVTAMIRHDRAIKPSGAQIWPQEYSQQSHEHEENI